MRSTLWVLVLICCWGCSTLLPERKAPLPKPKIMEEDVTGGAGKPEAPVQEPIPIGPGPATADQGTTEQAPPVLGTSPGAQVEPQERHRRRFINRGGKWEPAQERPEANQPRPFY